MFIVLEYLSSVFLAAVLVAFLFGTSALFVLSQEGAKQLAPTSRKVAERTLQWVAAAAKSAQSLSAFASRVDH
jgi:hypothetical protein